MSTSHEIAKRTEQYIRDHPDKIAKRNTDVFLRYVDNHWPLLGFYCCSECSELWVAASRCLLDSLSVCKCTCSSWEELDKDAIFAFLTMVRR